MPLLHLTRLTFSVQTGACDTDNIKSLQLTFVGASQYFPGDYNISDPSDFEKLRKAIESDTAILTQNSQTTFSGSIKNLTYNSGGDFDVGITVTHKDGTVIGYGISDMRYVIKQAIHISPPEVLIQIKAGNQRIGLAWTAIGLPFLIAGLTGLINLLISHFKFFP